SSSATASTVRSSGPEGNPGPSFSSLLFHVRAAACAAGGAGRGGSEDGPVRAGEDRDDRATRFRAWLWRAPMPERLLLRARTRRRPIGVGAGVARVALVRK